MRQAEVVRCFIVLPLDCLTLASSDNGCFCSFFLVTGPLSELQIAYVCRETLQVMYLLK